MRLLTSLLTAIFVLGSSAALALDFEERQISPGGVPARYIFISGEFAPTDDLSRLSQLIYKARPDFVTFNSAGGNVVEAMEVGRLIRAAGLSTIQLRSLECASACAFAFMGGVRRVADPGSIGIHRLSLNDGHLVDIDETQKFTAYVIAYMTEMGVDAGLMQLVLSYSPDDIRYLSGSEMRRYGVTTDQTIVDGNRGGVGGGEPSACVSRTFAGAMPIARSGKIRHPKGSALLKSEPDVGARDLRTIPNETTVEITSVEGRWYRANVDGLIGYLHDTWVAVDQFEQGEFEDRYIQVRSFTSRIEAEKYACSSRVGETVWRSTNGWFAVTLSERMKLPAALDLLASSKSAGQIPDDSFVTYGNTYVRRVCCN
jgi:hypothetical protein